MAQNAYRGRTERMDADELPEDVQDEFLNGKTRSADVLYALLRDAYYRGPVSVGKGGERRVYGGGSPGTGLRRPDGPLYNMPESWRKGILSRAVDLDLLVQTDDADELDAGTFATTPRGRDLLLDADRCSDCGRVRTPRVSTETVELSRYSHTKNYHFITACPECESHAGDDVELGDDADDSYGGRDALSYREDLNESEENVALYANDDPSEFVEDPDEDAIQTDEDDAQDDDDEDDPSDADADERDEDDAQGDETTDYDPTYEEGVRVRVASEDADLSGDEGVIYSHFQDDDGTVLYRVDFDDYSTVKYYEDDDLSTMRPVEEKQETPEGPEFEDDRRDADGHAPPVEVVAAEFDALNAAVEKALSEGVEDAAGEENMNYLLEGDVSALRRVYSVLDRLDYAYAPTALYEPLDGDEDGGLLLVRWFPPEWVAPDTTRGVYVCNECGAGEVRDGSNVTVSELPETDAPRGWDVLLEQETHGVETKAVACSECGEQGLLGDEDAPWTGGAILSPMVHRTPAKFRVE